MPISSNQIVGKNHGDKELDFLSGAVLLIDKPLDWTSFDVVNKIRHTLKHTLGVKKIKVGHAGTLDPLATGLLLICTGKLTKDIDTLQAQAKFYSGSIALGATTATYDSEVEPNEYFAVDHITEHDLDAARLHFIGEIDQLPPIYSAIKIKGQKAYDLARKGKDVELEPRKVTIQEFNIDTHEFPIIHFGVSCSKGTYIRSLAHDYGVLLKSGGYLKSLRREKIGDFDIENALTVDEVVEMIKSHIVIS